MKAIEREIVKLQELFKLRKYATSKEERQKYDKEIRTIRKDIEEYCDWHDYDYRAIKPRLYEVKRNDRY